MTHGVKEMAISKAFRIFVFNVITMRKKTSMKSIGRILTLSGGKSLITRIENMF